MPLVALVISLMAVEALCSPGQCEPLAAAAPPQPQPHPQPQPLLLIEEVRWVVRDAAFCVHLEVSTTAKAVVGPASDQCVFNRSPQS